MHVLIKPASSLCNMRCNYCFYADVSDNREVKSFGIMNDETLEVIVKRVFEESNDLAAFSFQGGEPTLAGLPFFRRLVELQAVYNTKKISVRNAIQTNGYIIDRQWAEFFHENGFLVGLSLDGTKDLHDRNRLDANRKGTYNTVLNAAMILEHGHVEFNILCVVDNITARFGTKVYKSLQKHGFSYLQFIPRINTLGGTKDRSSLTSHRYADFLKATFDCYYHDFKNGTFSSIRTFDNYLSILLGMPPENCAMSGVCTCYFVIEADSSVYPCDFYVFDDWKLGNIHNHSFAELASTGRAKRFITMSAYQDPGCGTCRWYRLCRGGCRRDREPFVEQKPILNQYCSAYQDFFAFAYSRLVEMAAAYSSSTNTMQL